MVREDRGLYRECGERRRVKDSQEESWPGVAGDCGALFIERRKVISNQ
jgi:hypothetical protein